MTVDFQTWMRAVWTSIMEPSESARYALSLKPPAEALWLGLGLAAVLNVLFLATLQNLSTVPVAMEDQVFVMSPIGYLGVIGVFLVIFVFALQQAGRWLGSSAQLPEVLLVTVWFQAISLTLEAMQLVLVLISPAIAAIFGMIAFGAMLWCFVNFVNVLHGFANLFKAVFSILIALIVTALISGIILSLFGISTPGGTA